jgi:hypothetical protein
VSDLPANGYWLAWIAAALCVGWGLFGLVGQRMRFVIPLPHRPTTSERRKFPRVVTGNLARLFGIGYIGAGVLALVSFKAGAVVAAVLGVAGWAMGTAQDD